MAHTSIGRKIYTLLRNNLLMAHTSIEVEKITNINVFINVYIYSEKHIKEKAFLAESPILLMEIKYPPPLIFFSPFLYLF